MVSIFLPSLFSVENRERDRAPERGAENAGNDEFFEAHFLASFFLIHDDVLDFI
jgi:hypothetical protein